MRDIRATSGIISFFFLLLGRPGVTMILGISGIWNKIINGILVCVEIASQVRLFLVLYKIYTKWQKKFRTFTIPPIG